MLSYTELECDRVSDVLEDQLLTIFRKMADLYYKDLEVQYDYLTSDSEVQAWLESNNITE